MISLSSATAQSRTTCAALLASAALCCGCSDLNRFDTGTNSAYCGQIIDGRFVREGFERQLGLELHIDTAHLQTVPGDLRSSDADTGVCQPQALFNNAPLQVPQATLADALSGLQLSEDSDYNVLAWVQSSCQGSMLAVVSLMKSGQVEVRLLAPPGGTDTTGRFGVFHLTRQTSCSF